MRKNQPYKPKSIPCPATPRLPVVVILLLCAALAVQGCFDPVYPQLDRDARVMEALNRRDSRVIPPSPLSPSQAVAYALANNLDAKVAEIETAYHNESAVAARRRMLPSLTLRYSMDHSNHPSARWSESTRSGNQSLESSYSSDPNSRQGEVGMMWNLIDFGVGYLRSRQQGERIRYSEQQLRRVKQQVVLDVLTHYWRTSAATTVANEAEALRKELDEQAASIRDSIEMRILSGAEGARRELAVHGGIAELEQWRRAATQARLELARVMGCGNAQDFQLAVFPDGPPSLPPMPNGDPSQLQTAALQRRPELFQQDSQERIAVDEARVALLQMAPNANLSLSVYDDPDKFLEWGNWMTVGARVSWNLFNIPARLSERRVAKLQEETAKQKGLALAAAIMAQVGIAYSDWRLAHQYASVLAERAAARQRLVEALAAGEKDGQTRPGEVLQERVRLLSEKAASMRASAEARIAGARLANAVGLDVDANGRLLWNLGSGEPVDILFTPEAGFTRSNLKRVDDQASAMLPEEMSGLKIVKAEDFLTPDSYFADTPAVTRTPEQPAAREGNDTPGERVYEKGKVASLRPPPVDTPENVEDRTAARTLNEPAGIEDPLQPEVEKRIDFESYENMDRYPAMLAKGAGVNGTEEYGGNAPNEPVLDQFSSDVMMDLARTSYYEDVGATHISEHVEYGNGADLANRQIEIPEDIQAQMPPALEGFSDMRKMPLTSIAGLEGLRKERPQVPERAMKHEDVKLPPIPQELFDMAPLQPRLVPQTGLRPPEQHPMSVNPLDQERLDALSPLEFLGVPEPSAPVKPQAGRMSLRPPEADTGGSLLPPVAGPSPSDFGL